MSFDRKDVDAIIAPWIKLAHEQEEEIAKLKEAARDYMANGCDDHDALAKLLEEVCDE